MLGEPVSGVAWTDAAGYATVVLPDAAAAPRRRFRCELAPLRPGVHAVVVAEPASNQLTIHSDEPHVKVAWRLVPIPERR